MTIKEMFKMIENTNAFNELVGNNKRNYISIKEDNIFSLKDKNDNSRFYSYKELQKALKYFYISEVSENLINADFEQETEYKNYFKFENYELGIFED